MQIINPQIIAGKKILLRFDIDVALGKGAGPLREARGRLQVTEDFKLKAGIPTLNLCLQNATAVTLMGHIGRPEGKVVADLKVEPIKEWFITQGYEEDLDSQKLILLENLRFDPREESCDMEYAKELAGMGDVYINEAFSSYHPAVSTTVLPTLLPHAAGLRFTEEVNKLQEVRDNPKKSSISEGKNLFIAIMGGAKVTDKLPVIEVLAKKADVVLVGGKLVQEIKEQGLNLPKNVMVGKLSEDGFDIAAETINAWSELIRQSRMIVWNGPLGKFEDPKNNQSAKLAKLVLESKAEIIVGGGDTVSLLGGLGLLKEYEEKGFVSVGGGAMLKFLADGTLPTIEVLR